MVFFIWIVVILIDFRLTQFRLRFLFSVCDFDWFELTKPSPLRSDVRFALCRTHFSAFNQANTSKSLRKKTVRCLKYSANTRTKWRQIVTTSGSCTNQEKSLHYMSPKCNCLRTSVFSLFSSSSSEIVYLYKEVFGILFPFFCSLFRKNFFSWSTTALLQNFNQVAYVCVWDGDNYINKKVMYFKSMKSKQIQYNNNNKPNTFKINFKRKLFSVDVHSFYQISFNFANCKTFSQIITKEDKVDVVL